MTKTKKVRPSKTGRRTRTKTRTKTKTNKVQKGGDSNTNFINAVSEGDLEYVENQVGNITDLSFENSDGNTPLEIAINKYNELRDSGDDTFDNFEKSNIFSQIISILLENGANGENIRLPRFNFVRVDLTNAKLKGADLTGSDLEEAILDGANLENANLTTTDLQDTQIRNANLTNTNFTNANMDGANINGSITQDANFTGTLYDPTSTTELPGTPDNVFRTTTDLPDIQPRRLNFDETISNIDMNVNYDNSGDISDIESDPTNNNNMEQVGDEWLLDLMDSAGEHAEPDPEREERLKREREEKKQLYMEHPTISLKTNTTNPFETVGMSGYNAIMMEDISFCEYIKENKDNVIFINEKQVGMFDKSTIRPMISNETLDETKVVYQCKELSEAFIPHNENIISGPMLNMRIIGMFGLMIPFEFLDEVVKGEHQIFVIETPNNQKTIPIASLATRLAMGDNESGSAVVSADHCQAEVSIQVGNLSYIENKVLLNMCGKTGGKKRKTYRKKQKKTRQAKKNRTRKNKKKKN